MAKLKIFQTLCCLGVLFFSLEASARSLYLSEALQNPRLQRELTAIVEAGIQKAYGRPYNLPEDLSGFWNRSRPIFVTLKASGKTRACMGSLQAQKNTLLQEIWHKLDLAFFQDPRHPKVTLQELGDIEVYLTEVGPRTLVPNIQAISPARDGVYLQQGLRGAVVLPGEAKTQSYLLKFLLSKSGAKANQSYQIYRLKTLTLPVLIQISKS